MKVLKECEILVVGAGPAGSSAAMAAAEGGARTLLIDRKKEIGTPVQCGEVVGETLLRKLKLKLPPGALAAKLDHTTFLLDRRVKLTSREPYWKAVTLERKIFDKALAARAAEAGAMVHADARLTDIKMDGGQVVQATIMHQGVEAKVHPKVIVAADGVHSTLSRLMNVELFTEKAMAKGIEYEMVSSRRLPSGMQIFLEPEVGLGYGWVIPKGPRRANVGLAAIGLKGSRRDRLQEWLTTNPMLASLFDVAFAGGAILALSPLLVVVALAVKVQDGGPVFFTQRRMGRGNRFFNMYKFRSMTQALCDTNGNVSASKDDQRITRIGRFIRRTSIDELPQLFNVLLGDMSLVGPRPHATGSLAGDKLFWEVDLRYW